MQTPTYISAKQLQLRDVVRLKDSHSPFGTCVVKQITEQNVTFFRPYVHSDDLSYTGGVICYIGIEIFDVPLSTHCMYELLERHSTR